MIVFETEASKLEIKYTGRLLKSGSKMFKLKLKKISS